MSVAGKLSFKFALLLSGRSALLLLGLAMTAILTRALGPQDFGFYRTAVAYLGLAVVIADLGLGSIFVREISREGADQTRIIGSALTLRLTVATGVLSLATALAFLLNLPSPARLGIIGGAAGFVAYSVHLMLFGLFQQKLRQGGVVIAEITSGLVLLVAVIVMTRAGASPALLATALGTSYLLTLLISLIFARRLASISLIWDRVQWRSLMKAALPLAVTGTLAVLYIRADSVLLALLSSPEMVGLYGVPIKISDSIMGIALLLAGLFAPLFSHSAGTDGHAFSNYVSRGLGAMLAFSCGSALALNALATEIVVLLGGAAFADAAIILRWLSPFMIVHPLVLMLREAAVALDVQRRLVRVYVAGATAAFAAYVPLISLFDASGAAMSLLAGDIIVFTCICVIVRRAAPEPVSLGIVLRVAVAGCVAAAVLATAIGLGASWWIKLTLCLLTYGALLFATRVLTVPGVLALTRGGIPRARSGPA